MLKFPKVRSELFHKLYDFHSFNIPPKLSLLFAGDAHSYPYLAESIRKHPNQQTLKGMMERAGFGRVEMGHLTNGVEGDSSRLQAMIYAIRAACRSTLSRASSMPIPYRRFAATAAVIGWLALGLQLVLSIQLAVGNGKAALAGVWIYLGYFTVLTNLLAALALTAASGKRPWRCARFFAGPDVQTATAMSIIVVAAVYHLLLRQLWQPHGWQIVGDDALHTVMPLLFVLHWWLAVPKANLRWRQVVAWQAYPAGYFIYALVRGALNGWYPYPFLDVAALGYPRVLVNASAVLLVFIAVGLLLIALGRWQARHRATTASSTPTGR